MNLNKLFIKKEDADKTITGTLLILSAVALLIAAGLEMAGIVKNTSVLLEFCVANMALYAGRKYQGKNGASLDGKE